MSQGREPLPTHVRDLPALPTPYHDALARGLGELGLELDPAARSAIDDHVRLLLAWNPAINLTAIVEPASVAIEHVVDSLSALPWLRMHGVTSLVDLGSGGGYPGLPLGAALGASRVALVDATAKKARFLDVVVEAMGLGSRVRVYAERAEALARDPAHRGRQQAVTARAVAALADLVELAFPLLAPGGSLLAWKRGDLREELAGARRAMDALGGGELDVLDVSVTGLREHRLVVATTTGAVPDTYPRDPAARRRDPW